MMADQNEMLKIVTPMAEEICDHLCRFLWETERKEDLEDICAECKMGQYVCDILNTYNQEKQKWIPVTDRLPRMEECKVVTAGGEYFRRLEVAVQTDTIEYFIGYFDRHKWFDKRHRGFKGDVVAWKIHRPYKPC